MGARAPGRSAASGRCTSICCRRATPAVPRARTSRAGWRTSRSASTSRHGARLTADNPFPAIHGRVCYHPCESVCNRAELDSPLSIHAVERFLGDLALEQGWRFDPPPVRSGKRVLVIGAGPSGLSAAYHLARLGHEVEIRDAGPEPGGMMRYGIPAYRLPRDVMGAEVERIAALGVRFTARPSRRGPRGGAPRGGLRRGVRGGRRAPVQAGRDPRGGRRAHRGRGVLPARRRRRASGR